MSLPHLIKDTISLLQSDPWKGKTLLTSKKNAQISLQKPQKLPTSPARQSTLAVERLVQAAPPPTQKPLPTAEVSTPRPKQAEFSALRSFVERFLPHLALTSEPLDDTLAKLPIVLYLEETEEELQFLKNLAKAVQGNLISALTIQPEMCKNRLLIATPSALKKAVWAAAFDHYPLLPLTDYLKDPSLKKTLWTQLCQRIKK